MALSESACGCAARRGSQGMAGPFQGAQRGSAATGSLPSGQTQCGHPLCRLRVPTLGMPPWGSWLARREHAWRLTALRLAESTINYDAVH